MGEFTQNCSLCEECENLLEFQTKSLTDRVALKLCEFVFVSNIVIILHLLDILICSEFKLKKLKLTAIKNESRRLIHIISLSLLILTLPFITMLVTLALLYKIVCSVVIKRKDRRFVKFLDSFDVFYCLEDKTTTDIQGVIQSENIELAVIKIKEKLHNLFMNYGSDKIFYRRNEEYGFYYWRRYSFIDLAQYVQTVEIPEMSDDKTEQNLKSYENADIVSYNDEGLFNVLIVNSSTLSTGKNGYKLILKFHHSVKDAAQLDFVARFVKEADDCHVTLVCKSDSQDYNNSPEALMNMITKLCSILAQSFDDNISRKNNVQDHSIIRMKTLEWTISDENLLCKVNDVRNNVCDLFR